jgi:poly-gamma-glutamate synthesis protein (capsule biosynthesis protein)
MSGGHHRCAACQQDLQFPCPPQGAGCGQGRFDALALSNNHSGDYGQEGFVDTMRHLEAAGIRYFGGGRNLAEAHEPLWIARKGLRIAVLGYNEFKPRSFEAGARRPGIAWSEDSQVLSDIRAARKAGADLVIPFMHWGWEREPAPSARQRQLARRMIDAGAAAVVGGHPHVTQGAEIYKGRPIIYSLGNFVFDGFELPAARVGWLLSLSLDRKGVWPGIRWRHAWTRRACRHRQNRRRHPAASGVTGSHGCAVQVCWWALPSQTSPSNN